MKVKNKELSKGSTKVLASLPAWSIHLKALHAILLLASLAGLIYAKSLSNGFVFDDIGLVLINPGIQNLSRFPKVFGWDARRPVPLPPDQGVTHRPVRTATLALQYALFGRHPAGYRTVNILLHVLNGSLIFVLLRTLLGRPWPALGAAVLFIVHPIQTESVAYIAGQRDVLFTTFYLLGFLSFVWYRATDRPGYLSLTGLAYLLGLFTKEMAITLPLLCVAYDLVRCLPGAGAGVAPPLTKALQEGLRVVFEQSKRLYLIMGAALALILYYFVVIANPSHRSTLYGGGLGPTLNTSARIVVYYLKQLVFPLTLNADYSYNAFPVSTSVADPRGLLALLILAGLWYGLFRLLRADRWAAFGGVWFFLTLLPVSQIIPHHELVAEHFLYLPSVGFCLLIAHFVERGLAVRRYAMAVAIAFGLAVLLLGVRAVVRNHDWKDELTLWTKTVQTAPQSWRARTNLGQVLKDAERYEEAIQQYQAVIAILPDAPSGNIAIGDTYRAMGRYSEAVEQFSKALALSPESIAARVGLAQSYAALGQHDKVLEVSRGVSRVGLRDERSYRRLGDALGDAGLSASAIEVYRKGLELAPYDPTLYARLGRAYEGLGQHKEAEAAYRQVVGLEPRSASAHANLGTYFLQSGRLSEAVRSFQDALRLSPDSAAAHSNLGIAYYRMGRTAEAVAEFQRALAIEPDSPEFRQNLALAQSEHPEPSLAELESAALAAPTSAKAHYNLGSAYANRRDLARADREFQRALRLEPANPLIHYAVGLLHFQKGDREAARRAWEHALQLDSSFTLARERLAELKGDIPAPAR